MSDIPLSEESRKNCVKIAISTNENELLEIPIPAWLFEKGPNFWLLGMNSTIDKDGNEEYYKVEILLKKRDNGKH